MQVRGTGSLAPRVEPDLDDPLASETFRDLETATVGNRTFVFASGNGNIHGFEMAANGSLAWGDHQSTSKTAWYARALETFERDGQAYLLSAGQNGVLGLFAISDRGSLTEVDVWDLGDGFTFTDLAVADIAATDLFVASDRGANGTHAFRLTVDWETIDGRSREDDLLGTRGDDRMFGRGKADLMRGRDRNDHIEGGAGRDDLRGGDGEDDICGGGGNDRICGNGGNDWLFGDDGRGTLLGGAGQDRAFGGKATTIFAAAPGPTCSMAAAATTPCAARPATTGCMTARAKPG